MSTRLIILALLLPVGVGGDLFRSGAKCLRDTDCAAAGVCRNPCSSTSTTSSGGGNGGSTVSTSAGTRACHPPLLSLVASLFSFSSAAVPAAGRRMGDECFLSCSAAADGDPCPVTGGAPSLLVEFTYVEATREWRENHSVCRVCRVSCVV